MLGNLTLCVAIVGFVVLPVCTLFADRENRIEEQRKVLMRLAAIAAQAANVQSIASDTNAQMQGGEFLVGSNENVISADLQTKLKAMAEAGGAKLRAVQALPVKTVDQIRYSGSRIEISGSLQSIVRTVHAIESSKPYLFIAGATLRSPPPPRQGASEEPAVQAQLDIFGAVQAGGQP
ncbi:type II secretion system protein GspM [Bradyrhizobium sp. AZCC 1578]|uniref:type II secretion system protein GspM n=1 Tax=Bradyrhizobium sp. AZCC 1578 TaxID=3117027 RepID=UPI002FF21A2B